MGKTFTVNNWEKFQHYRKAVREGQRHITWIKLYFAILRKYEFQKLSDKTKWHVIGIFLLAGEHDNKGLPYDAEWVTRELSAETIVDLDAIATAGFITINENASTPLALCLPREEEIREENPPLPPFGGNGVAREETCNPPSLEDNSSHQAGSLQSDPITSEPSGAAEMRQAKLLKSNRRLSPKRDETTPSFEEFWREWPRNHRKVAKAKCLRFWLRNELDTISKRIVAAVKWHKASREWRKDEGAYVPLPFTWLYQSRWEGAPEVVAKVPKPDAVADFIAAKSDAEVSGLVRDFLVDFPRANEVMRRKLAASPRTCREFCEWTFQRCRREAV